MKPAISKTEFLSRAERHWTAEKCREVTGGKKLLLQVPEDAWFLYGIGLLDDQARMERAHVKKFQQINHLLRLLEPDLKNLSGSFAPLRILDVGCGNSYLSFLLAWYCIQVKAMAVQLIGVDHRADVITRSQQRAAQLGWQKQVRFVQADFKAELSAPDLLKQAFPDQSFSQERFHLVAALHACDTATDQAIAFAVRQHADAIAVAPCCQAELNRLLSEKSFAGHPLQGIFENALLSREAAALMTDTMRVLCMRKFGYEVSITEFVDAQHTPKNRLLRATRRGRFHKASEAQYLALCQELKETEICLNGLIGVMD